MHAYSFASSLDANLFPISLPYIYLKARGSYRTRLTQRHRIEQPEVVSTSAEEASFAHNRVTELECFVSSLPTTGILIDSLRLSWSMARGFMSRTSLLHHPGANGSHNASSSNAFRQLHMNGHHGHACSRGLCKASWPGLSSALNVTLSSLSRQRCGARRPNTVPFPPLHRIRRVALHIQLQLHFTLVSELAAARSDEPGMQMQLVCPTSSPPSDSQPRRYPRFSVVIRTDNHDNAAPFCLVMILTSTHSRHNFFILVFPTLSIPRRCPYT
ncbi:hypothetical protein C8F01DRAFT_1368404 [Mycena amicta]|nr:hypothetical protein C8F01DRAFT_1368404 [Mycena amicta]